MSLKDAQSYFRADFFQNGLAYYDANKVVNPSRYQNKLYAQVQGSGARAYTVILEFEDKLKATCTCPAARRYTFCKHAAAVLAGWARNPDSFVVADSAPELKKPGSKKARVKKGKVDTDELIARGLESVETLTTELILSGLSTITPGRVEQVRDLAENLRTYKLRRLSTLLTRFAGLLNTLLTDKDHFQLQDYAEVLADIVLTTKGVQGIQQGKLQDSKYMEELVGKTWRDKDLTPRNDLELVGLFFSRHDTVDNYVVFANYFVELSTGDILTKKFIIPTKQVKRSAEQDTRSYAGCKLMVSEALQYPGYPPFRLKLTQCEERHITRQDIETTVSKANGDFAKAITDFRAFKKDFFAPADYYALLKPQGFYASGQNLAVFDAAGTALDLMFTGKSALMVETLLQTSSINVLFGKIRAMSGSLKFEPLSAILLSQEKPVVPLV